MLKSFFFKASFFPHKLTGLPQFCKESNHIQFERDFFLNTCLRTFGTLSITYLDTPSRQMLGDKTVSFPSVQSAFHKNVAETQ